MIVAITGASGFIGRTLCSAMNDDGLQARAVTRRHFEAGVLREAFDGADVVVHAAGATRAPSAVELDESNVQLTRQVLEAASEANVGRLVLISSQAAAGPARALDQPITEESQPLPIEAYGRSKLAAEHVVAEQSAVPFVIVRPSSVYGPGDHDFLTMFRLSRFGFAVHPGNADQWLSIVHVDDVVRAITAAAIMDRAEGRTYFVCNDEAVRWRDLFAATAASLGRTIVADINVPAPFVTLGAKIGDLAATLTHHASLMTSEKVALTKPAFWVCSNERAKRELAFAPSVTLRDGLAETARWYREHRWL
jgi:nucleoside-diphosphate-sugar epimerase